LGVAGVGVPVANEVVEQLLGHLVVPAEGDFGDLVEPIKVVNLVEIVVRRLPPWIRREFADEIRLVSGPDLVQT
jgi:hypothetical protein